MIPKVSDERENDLNRGRFFVYTHMKALLGIKMHQTQQFTPSGVRMPVTEIEAGPCYVVRVADMGNFRNLQIAFGTKKHSTKAEEGHIKKAGLDKKPRFLREIRETDASVEIKPGTEVKVSDVFTVGDMVTITGTSKGKGFAGVVKRHGFQGGPRTHGQSDRERSPGSIGQTTTPGRVYRGKRMAGRMGNDRVSVKGLKVVAIDTDKNILTVKGLVPGGTHGLLIIRKEN